MGLLAILIALGPVDVACLSRLERTPGGARGGAPGCRDFG